MPQTPYNETGGTAYAHIATGAATTTVKSGGGVLHRIFVNVAVGAAITMYDSLTGTGTVIGILGVMTANNILIYDVQFNTGLTLVTTGTQDLTVSFG